MLGGEGWEDGLLGSIVMGMEWWVVMWKIWAWRSGVASVNVHVKDYLLLACSELNPCLT